MQTEALAAARPAVGARGRRLLLAAALGVLVGLVVRTGPLHPLQVVSGSMSPTIRIGDWLAVTDLGDDERGGLRRGDLVVYRHPAGSDGRAVKRIVAVAGDAVEVAGPQSPVRPCRTATGKATSESAGAGLTAPDRCETVPPGHYFIVGDNTAASLDSRTLGPLAAADVVGRVRFVVHRPW